MHTVCIYEYSYMYVCIYIWHVHMYSYTLVSVRARTHAWASICVDMCIKTLGMHYVMHIMQASNYAIYMNEFYIYIGLHCVILHKCYSN